MSEVSFTSAQRAEMSKVVAEKATKELEPEVSVGEDNDSETVVSNETESDVGDLS